MVGTDIKIIITNKAKTISKFSHYIYTKFENELQWKLVTHSEINMTPVHHSKERELKYSYQAFS